MRFGYARVSSTSQSLDLQIAALNGKACEIIRQEKITGTTTENRRELAAILDFIREGDELWVTRLDRLARSVPDLCAIVAHLEKIGATLHCIEQPIETKTPTGRLMLTILGAFAEFETSLRKERQMEGIAAAKAKGIYAKPRGPRFDPAEIRRMHRDNMTPRQIMRKLRCSRMTVYRALDLNSPSGEELNRIADDKHRCMMADLAEDDEGRNAILNSP